MELKVYWKIGGFEQILCEVVPSPIPKRIIGIDIMSDGGLLPPPNNIVKQGV